jgi:S-formylglutathione hydrolase FrmB
MVLGAGFDLDWDEELRGHDWDFWDSQIKKVIGWLPLGATDATLSSGNVAKDVH